MISRKIGFYFNGLSAFVDESGKILKKAVDQKVAASHLTRKITDGQIVFSENERPIEVVEGKPFAFENKTYAVELNFPVCGKVSAKFSSMSSAGKIDVEVHFTICVL